MKNQSQHTRRSLRWTFLWIGAFAFFVQPVPVPAAPPLVAVPWHVSTRDAHANAWESICLITNGLTGRVFAEKREYIELGTGLNYFDPTLNRFEPTREEWQVTPEALVAQFGPCKAILTRNLNLAGAVDVLVDNVRLISNPVGTGLYDPVDGKQLWLAGLRDCAAEWGNTTREILFRDCFDNGFRASIRYTYRRTGLSQDLILEQRLALPPGFSDRTRLEFYTEFDAATPAPRIGTRIIREESDPAVRAQMLEPDLTDMIVDFGGTRLEFGKAFAVGNIAHGKRIPVAKTYRVVDGRPVLIEAVEFWELAPLLAQLEAAVNKGDPNAGLAIHHSRKLRRTLRHARLQRPVPPELLGTGPQLAQRIESRPGVVIDYEQVINGTTNMVFTNGVTFLISGTTWLHGQTTIEGGSVLKFTTEGSLSQSDGSERAKPTQRRHGAELEPLRDEHQYGKHK